MIFLKKLEKINGTELVVLRKFGQYRAFMDFWKYPIVIWSIRTYPENEWTQEGREDQWHRIGLFCRIICKNLDWQAFSSFQIVPGHHPSDHPAKYCTKEVYNKGSPNPKKPKQG